MKIFFAGLTTQLTGLSEKEYLQKNVLIAYPQAKREKIVPQLNWFIDSGAFSVFTGVERIDIDDYIKDLKIWNCPTYAGLDVIGSAKETKKNCDYMKSKGLSVIPTFHYGEDFKFLEEYCKEYDYIALGGVAQLRTFPRVKAWLDECWTVIKKYWPIKVHGFAITGERYLKLYPFYSVDSTGWVAGGKFNRVLSATNKEAKIYKPLHYRTRNTMNLNYFAKLERDVTELWKRRGISWQE